MKIVRPNLWTSRYTTSGTRWARDYADAEKNVAGCMDLSEVKLETVLSSITSYRIADLPSSKNKRNDIAQMPLG